MGPEGLQAIARQLALRRETAAGGREVQGAAGGRAQRERRAAVRSGRRAARRRDAAAADVSALRAGRRGRTRGGAVRASIPGREGSLGDIAVDRRRAEQRHAPLLIVQGVLLTPLARAADFVLPGASYVEKEASYTNDQGRLQGTARAIPPPGDAMEDWQILVNLARSLGLAFDYTSGGARARRHRGPLSRRSKGSPATRPDVQPAGVGAALAAGVEPVGAVEVGFHVPGPAAGERRRRSDGVADGAGMIALREVK